MLDVISVETLFGLWSCGQKMPSRQFHHVSFIGSDSAMETAAITISRVPVSMCNEGQRSFSGASSVASEFNKPAACDILLCCITYYKHIVQVQE